MIGFGGPALKEKLQGRYSAVIFRVNLSVSRDIGMEQGPTHGVHFTPARTPKISGPVHGFHMSKIVLQNYELGERCMAAIARD